ncbi:RNA-binding protein Cwf29 [Friedmanniomyces endolithicus]|uniref:RNA-binding protein Cwf29 n=1 Tax=Friedmanniomyces endolithicus TaxID=329885 RepID=A0A4U0U1V2_9PEZI|nr:RNA-binding protein Cwf29 [Friedmanniomyces endolithicus]KAK0312764.1 RNA-binding protein Cwf29 [Friedmanniomyces endolithicus]KAK0827479.1 RNA-binding protein Cwf29 [Friedmanniomyces endolithicus]KAK0927603.1 RNA-binding protein Cwf29 [Friedmanniomyces endolithicus]KAK0982109.1 RNA-binding protein Cwf29 [Friedmanniomyces endolithicus]
MQSIKQVQRLNDTELEKVVPSNASWHTDYRDTAYIYIGGLPFELSEGDILTIFSQYGNPVHVNLVRDKETGKSRGYCFLKYEDQRSCDLAVDNLSGAGVMGRLLSVDHTRYKKKEGEVEGVGDVEEAAAETDEEGQSRSKRRRTESVSEGEQERPMIPEESELANLRREMDDDDPMKAYIIKEKQAEVEEALKALAMSKHKSKDTERDREHRHRHRHRYTEREHADMEQDVKHEGHKSRRERAPDEKATMRQSHVDDGDSDGAQNDPLTGTTHGRVMEEAAENTGRGMIGNRRRISLAAD